MTMRDIQKERILRLELNFESHRVAHSFHPQNCTIIDTFCKYIKFSLGMTKDETNTVIRSKKHLKQELVLLLPKLLYQIL